MNFHGVEHCFQLLVTARQLTAKAFSRAWNSACTNFLREHIPHMLGVVEAHKRGYYCHRHTLAALPFTCPNFPHDTYKRCQQAYQRGQYLHSKALWQHVLKLAGPEFEAFWKLLQAELPKYGLGKFIGLQPVRVNARAMAVYLGKYLAKSFEDRPPDWKHVRLTRYSRPHGQFAEWKRSTPKRSSAGPGGWLWRARLGKFADVLGVSEAEGFKRLLGRRWFWHHKDTINRVEIRDFPSGLHAAADGHSPPPEWNGWPDGPVSIWRGKKTIWDGDRAITFERGGYLTATEAALEALRKASTFIPAARRFLEQFFRSVRPVGYIEPAMMECPF